MGERRSNIQPRKAWRNRKGAALLYTVIALTLIATVCIALTLVSTNLYRRTAATASRTQAMLLAKSIGQCFAAQVAENNYNVSEIVDYLQTHPGEKINATATMQFNPDDLSASVANKGELTSLSVTDANIAFYLNSSKNYLYGDVSVNYNGASATVTVIFSCLDGFDRTENMYDLFSKYNIYLTYPDVADGFKFIDSGNVEPTGSKKPNVYLYNGDGSGVDTAQYKLQTSVEADLTTTGDVRLLSNNSTERHIQGKLTSYGDLTLGTKIVVDNNVYCVGKLVVGSSSSYTGSGVDNGARINGNIYCLGNVVIYGNSATTTIVDGNIYATGHVEVYNAQVNGTIYSTGGNVKLRNSTSKDIRCNYTVTLEKNSKVDGTRVYAGNLQVTDSSLNVNYVTVAAANGTTGNMSVTMTDTATSTKTIGKSTTSQIVVGGNLTILRKTKKTYDQIIYGSVTVHGGLTDPTASNSGQYPYTTKLNGNLVINGGIPKLINGVQYNVNYLIGLEILRPSGVSESNAGNVWCVNSLPMFSKGEGLIFGRNSITLANDGISVYSRRLTTIEGNLRVGRNMALTDADTTVPFAGDEIYLCLNNATLNNVYVGEQSHPYSIAVWGGTIDGSIVAHHVRLMDVNAGAKTSGAQIHAMTYSDNLASIAVENSKYEDLDSTVTIAADMVATGDLTIGSGVKTTGKLHVGQNAMLAGQILGLTVVGVKDGEKAATPPYVIIWDTASLVGSGYGTGLFVNGNVRVEAVPQSLMPIRSKPIYVTGKMDNMGKVGKVYLTTDDALLRTIHLDDRSNWEPSDGGVERDTSIDMLSFGQTYNAGTGLVDDLSRQAIPSAPYALTSAKNRAAATTYSPKVSSYPQLDRTDNRYWNPMAIPLDWQFVNPDRIDNSGGNETYAQTVYGDSVKLSTGTTSSGKDGYMSYAIKQLGTGTSVNTWANLQFATDADANARRISCPDKWEKTGIWPFQKTENTAGISLILEARGSADMLVMTKSLKTTAHWIANEIRPVGIFFFESGFVDPKVTTSYKSTNHSTNNVYNDSKIREDAETSLDEESGRYRWGATGVSSEADVVWTFFTCVDPRNPYTSAAKDLHIVMPKHTYMQWEKDKDSAVNIIGNGRVFLYLQEDTSIKVVGNGLVNWGADFINNSFIGGVFTAGNNYTVFGGLRLVDPDTGKLDPTSGGVLQPRMYIVGLGPNIRFEVADFQTAAYVYMPTGYNYDNASLYGKGLNTFAVTASKASGSEQCDIYGIYVCDRFEWNNEGSRALHYIYTEPDLTDTTIYYGSSKMTTSSHPDARYSLEEFWNMPRDIGLEYLRWTYQGIAVG